MFTTFLIIGPPCVLMGASLPLLTAFFSRLGHADESVAWLYGWNTLGAAVGCYAAGFHLLPSVGLFWTNSLAGLFNLAIGAAGMVLGARFRQGLLADPPHPNALPGEGVSFETPPPLLSRIRICIAAGMTGFAALVLQVVWSRQLALIVGGSTYAFSACLFVILLGIALGSVLLSFYLRRFRGSEERLIAQLIVVIGAGLIAGQMAIPALQLASRLSTPAYRSSCDECASCVFASSCLGLVASLGMGALLPLLIRGFHKGTGAAGSALGTIYAANMAGSIVGAGVTSMFVIPWLGFSKTVAAALAVYFVVALAFLPFHDWKARGRVLVYTAIAAGLVVFCSSEPDPRGRTWACICTGRRPWSP